MYEYLQATSCPLSPLLARRKTIITVIQTVQTFIAVIAVIAYERRMRQHLQGNRAGAKLITFKLIIMIEALQNMIFRILTSAGVFTPTYHISTFDFSVGVPALMLCCELLIFALSFCWSYSYSPYRKLSADGRPKIGFWHGLLDVVNISDIIQGIGYLFKACLPKNFGKQYVQRPSDATMVAEGQDKHLDQSGSESDPDSLQKASAPVHPIEKV